MLANSADLAACSGSSVGTTAANANRSSLVSHRSIVQSFAALQISRT
jgi:hypothetical protein